MTGSRQVLAPGDKLLEPIRVVAGRRQATNTLLECFQIGRDGNTQKMQIIRPNGTEGASVHNSHMVPIEREHLEKGGR